MGPCVASVESNGALIAAISGGGETMSVIPVSGAVNLNGVGAGQVIGAYIGSDTAETGSTTTVINATSHVAKVGDWIQMVSSAAPAHEWSTVSAIAANTITVAQAFTTAPVNGNTFYILRPKPAQGNSGGVLWVDIQSGQQSANATGLLKLIDAASGATDAGVAGLTIRDDSGATKTTTAGDYQGLYTNPKGALYMDYRFGWQSSSSDGLLKQEDAAIASGDAGVLGLGVNNRSMAAFNTTQLDATPLGTGDFGNVLSSPVYDASLAGFSPIRLEDTGFAASEPVMMAGAQAVSAIVQTVGATGDVAPLAVDLGNRLVTTLAPAGEMFSSCSSAITGTSRTAIKAAVASNRIYTTSITCSNSGAAASIFNISDGAGTQLAVGALAATVGSYTASFPTPLRGSVNTDLSVTMNTTSTSTICCANGYISTI